MTFGEGLGIAAIVVTILCLIPNAEQREAIARYQRLELEIERIEAGRSEAEVKKFTGKLPSCPLCSSKVCSEHENCFHCKDCGYLQCCDYNGFYDRHRFTRQKVLNGNLG